MRRDFEDRNYRHSNRRIEQIRLLRKAQCHSHATYCRRDLIDADRADRRQLRTEDGREKVECDGDHQEVVEAQHQ
jgi:hypothetical protein